MNNQSTLVSRLEESLSYTDFKIRSYSGRGMYGKECVAVSCDTEGEVLAEIAANDSTLLKEMGNYRTDSLGMRRIIYWPQVQFSEYEN